MTAKEQVLKVYPKAFVNRNWSFGRCCIMTGVGLTHFGVAESEEQAWQSAANKLNNQNHERTIHTPSRNPPTEEA